MDYQELLAADIAVERGLLTPDQAAHGLDALGPDDRAQIDEVIKQLLDASNGDARLALARRGMDRKLHASLPPKTSHAVADGGTRIRAPLRPLDEDHYTGSSR